MGKHKEGIKQDQENEVEKDKRTKMEKEEEKKKKGWKEWESVKKTRAWAFTCVAGSETFLGGGKSSFKDFAFMCIVCSREVLKRAELHIYYPRKRPGQYQTHWRSLYSFLIDTASTLVYFWLGDRSGAFIFDPSLQSNLT